MNLPRRLRQPLEILRTLWSAGFGPEELWAQWRHRAAMRRVQRSLFYHRWASALLLAHELGLFDALRQPLTVEEAARAASVHPRAAEALLRVLESQELVTRAAGRYSLTEFAGEFLAGGGRRSLQPMLELMAAEAAAFAELPGAMATGRVPAPLDIFTESSRYRAFLDAVNEYLSLAARDLLARIELPPVQRFIVGSMGVSTSAALMEKFPSARVTYGCLAHLVREIPRLRERYGVEEARVDGMHAHGGDPSADRWGDERFDLVFLTKKMILAPEERIGEKFARKAYQVLAPGGTAIFWETVHPESQPTPLARAMEAVLDLGAGPTGLVNTDRGIERLLGEIGFRQVEIVPCLGGQTTFVVARR
jgi:hypothetical protein